MAKFCVINTFMNISITFHDAINVNNSGNCLHHYQSSVQVMRVTFSVSKGGHTIRLNARCDWFMFLSIQKRVVGSESVRMNLLVEVDVKVFHSESICFQQDSIPLSYSCCINYKPIVLGLRLHLDPTASVRRARWKIDIKPCIITETMRKQHAADRISNLISSVGSSPIPSVGSALNLQCGI